MTAIALCAQCQRPMPNWFGAIGFGSTSCLAICRECFNPDAPAQSRAPIELDQHLLALIDSSDDQLQSVACLAVQFSIQEADPQGIFADPTGLLRKALKALHLGLGYDYNLLQAARKLLIKRELWLPEGRQLTSKSSVKNKMKLGKRVHHVQALP